MDELNSNRRIPGSADVTRGGANRATPSAESHRPAPAAAQTEGTRKEITDYFRPSIERLRFILMFFLSIQLLGLPTIVGGYFQIICGFVPIAFFILSGYLVLREAHDREERILRCIKRTAITFGILMAAYIIINFFYYRAIDANMLSSISSKSIWFNFIVLNIWPFDIGGSIWYVQALLYAYIFIYILEKLNLLRFDWIIAAICLIPTVLTGELSGVINFNLLGYSYIAGNFFTRAIPYVLIGCAMHRKGKLFFRIHRSAYAIGIVIGAALSFFEIFLLNKLGVSGYYGHLLGMPIVAISVCMLAIKDRKDLNRAEKNFIPTREENRFFYYFLQPVGVGMSALLFVLFGYEAMDILNGLISVLSFAACYAVILIVHLIRRYRTHK